MDEERAKIQEDLRGLLTCEVRCDDVFLQMYASDASIYQIKPLGVVRPRSTADVVACVKYAREHHLPVHARGAGSGLSGESLGEGLVIDFSQHMRRIIALKEDRVRVQPGVVLGRLNEMLADYGRQFGPDPANGDVTTMGSVVAIDAAGSHSLTYGSARTYVESLQVVLSDGAVLELGKEPWFGSSHGLSSARQRDLVVPLADLLTKNKELIEQHRPRSRFNRSGYGVWDVMTGDALDVAKMLVGSEGTLALITEATLRTVPLPGACGVALLFFDRLENASRAALELRQFDLSACDLLDRRLLSLARDTDPRYDLLIPASAEAALLVEQTGDNEAEVTERLRETVDYACIKNTLAFDSRQVFEEDEVDLFWRLARAVVPTLYRLKGSTRPIPFVEDFAVPPEELPDFVSRLQNILKKQEVTASLFAHAGHGQLHLRPFLDLTRDEDHKKMPALAAELYQEVLAVGGTISGEHGDGLSRTPFVERQFGELYPVFREIKRIFDPHNIFNPGKIVGDDPFLMTRNLRPAMARSLQEADPQEGNGSPQVVQLQLNWEADEIVQSARACNGCGRCRSELPDVRMCPIFRFAPSEEASPRAKANLLRGVVTGELPPAAVQSSEFKQVADLCVNCKMCRLECPASVNIPRLVLEAKADYVAENGLRSSDWFLTRLPELAAFGSLVSPFANWLVGNPQARWLMEKFFGIAHGRKLPRFAARPFMRRAARQRLTRPPRTEGPKVVYFVDTYANFFDPQLAEALVAVFRHNGIGVYVHPEQKTSGMPLIALGAVDSARAVARHNVAILADAIRKGFEVVTNEPSAALCLTEEYPTLLDDPDARLVAEHSREACDYLWKLHRAGNLRLDFGKVRADMGYHEPCHLRALAAGTPGLNLMRLVPELRVRIVDDACSGMAGTFGLKRENFRSSLRAGWGLITAMRAPDLTAGTTECSACKMQMEQGTTTPTVHPLKILACSYGLMPEVEELLRTRGEDLVVT